MGISLRYNQIISKNSPIRVANPRRDIKNLEESIILITAVRVVVKSLEFKVYR